MPYKCPPADSYDKDQIYAEVRKIQGNNSLVSITRVFNDVEESPEKYPELNRIISKFSAKKARLVISLTLKGHNYTRWNNASGYTVKAVWMSPEAV